MEIPHLSQTVSKGITLKPWLKSIEGEAPVFQNLSVFKTAYAMAVHAGQKQALIAQNVANSDTPDYVTRRMISFSDIHGPEDRRPTVMRATRPTHLAGLTNDIGALIEEDHSFASPDGNSVSLETEMLKGTEAKRQHDRSLAIYGSALSVLRTSLGRQ